ncbi:MAG: hypothetical protein JW942_02640 [Opitutales bacterium]|nr:hypothetical protein [Opitutales bacterium]
MTKKPRNPQDSIYIYRIATLMALNLLTATAGGLGLLWMRQEISASAERIRETQLAINDTERRLQYVNVQIAEATSPEALKRRISELALELKAPTGTQTVYMAPLPEAAQDALPMAAPAEPIMVSFELALLKGGASSAK